MNTYKIVRYYVNREMKPSTMQKSLTLEKAQEWCSRADTSSKTHPKKKNGCKSEWFDGYTSE